MIVSDSAIHAILVDWTLGDDNGRHAKGAHDARCKILQSAPATTRSPSS